MSKPRSKLVRAFAKVLQIGMGGNAQELIETYQAREIPKPPSGSLEEALTTDLQAQLKAQFAGRRRVVKLKKKYLNF